MGYPRNVHSYPRNAELTVSILLIFCFAGYGHKSRAQTSFANPLKSFQSAYIRSNGHSNKKLYDPSYNLVEIEFDLVGQGTQNRLLAIF